MWVSYRIPGESQDSFVPVDLCNDGEYCFCDAAYDVFDYFVSQATDDGCPPYDSFVSQVIAAMPDLINGKTIAIVVESVPFTLRYCADPV